MRRLILVVVVLATVLALTGTAWGSNWLITLKSDGKGEAQAQGAPTAPTGVSAACTSSSAKTVKVSWSAVTKASSYTIYDATTSATGTYTSIASGMTTTSYISGTLSAANYWFKVAAYTGTNWVSAKSTATAESTISSSGCVQP